MTEFFDVGVVGTGYVGLATGASLAHLGHRVTCIDKDERRVAELGEGQIPFYEPGLEELMAKSAEVGCASRRSSTSVMREADVIFIAVNTPQGKTARPTSRASRRSRGAWAGRSRRRADRERPLVVVNKSTVPVGCGDYVSMLIREGAEDGGDGGGETFWWSPTPSS